MKIAKLANAWQRIDKQAAIECTSIMNT